MCLADVYQEREPLPALISFPVLDGIQDVMGFRLDVTAAVDRPRSFVRDAHPKGSTLVCSAGVWSCTQSCWRLRSLEREYCRVVQGRVRINDTRNRQWEFATGSAFLLLRGFEGQIEVLDPVRVAYMVFSMPDGGALDWCMASEGRTALGQDRCVS